MRGNRPPKGHLPKPPGGVNQNGATGNPQYDDINYSSRVSNQVSIKWPKPKISSLRDKQKIVIALYSYEGRDNGELSFEKGEKLVVIDDKEPDWWLAKALTTERTGYIPMNFVVNSEIETEE